MNIKRIIIVQLIVVFFSINLFFVTSNAASLDETFIGADNFVKKGVSTNIDKSQLHSASNYIYNALLGVGIVMAVIVGMILGIKYMTAESEEKAAVKESLVAYLIACCVIFGAFTIWKVVVEILN